MIFEVRGLKTDAYRGASVGNIFHGSDGYVVLTSYEKGAAFDTTGTWSRNSPAATRSRRQYVHFDNFLDAVRSRNPVSC